MRKLEIEGDIKTDQLVLLHTEYYADDGRITSTNQQLLQRIMLQNKERDKNKKAS